MVNSLVMPSLNVSWNLFISQYCEFVVFWERNSKDDFVAKVLFSYRLYTKILAIPGFCFSSGDVFHSCTVVHLALCVDRKVYDLDPHGHIFKGQNLKKSKAVLHWFLHSLLL